MNSRQKKYSILVRGSLLSLEKPVVMGVLNATPDSFYARSRTMTEEAIAARTHEIVEQGGSIIDVGACSTRPGGVVCDEATEMTRLRTALSVVRSTAPQAVISVDTFRADVARMAVEEYGADIINDVSQGGDPEMFGMVARLRCPYIYQSVESMIDRMAVSMARAIDRLHELGHCDVIVDPGFGFGKDEAQNYAVLRELDKLQVLHAPILVGVSRKRMIREPLGVSKDEALNGTTAVHAWALEKGANILRVHDVRAAVECCKLFDKMQNENKMPCPSHRE